MFKLGEIVGTVKGIIETKLELVKNDVQEKFIGIIFRILLLMFMVSFGLMVLLFFSFSLAFFLSQYTNIYMGFLLVGVLYLILFVIVYYARYSERMQRGTEIALRRFVFNKRTKIMKDE